MFGVSSAEYRSYAESNRDEWQAKGKGIVQEYLAKYNKQQEPSQAPVASSMSSSKQRQRQTRALGQENLATIAVASTKSFYDEELEV